MKWYSLAFLLFPAVGLASQILFQLPTKNASKVDSAKHGSNVLSIEEFTELSRPGVGVANEIGDLVLVSVSKFSVEERQYVHSFRHKYNLLKSVAFSLP